LEQTAELRQDSAHSIALSLALSEGSATTGTLPPHEAMPFVDKLFACSQPSISPSGKTCMHILPLEEIDKIMNE